MSLNIKNEQVHDLVRAAAQRTGLSQTSVVERALVELLARLDAEESDHRRRLDAILADFDAAAARAPWSDFGTDDLYDENGLPT